MHLQVTPSGRAHKSGLVTGDYITAINGQETKPLKHMQAMQLIKKSTQKVELTWWVYITVQIGASDALAIELIVKKISETRSMYT